MREHSRTWPSCKKKKKMTNEEKRAFQHGMELHIKIDYGSDCNRAASCAAQILCFYHYYISKQYVEKHMVYQELRNIWFLSIILIHNIT